MCGIYGIIQPGTKAADLRPMGEVANRVQAHRGPDQTGITAADGWLLAHRRLSIYDVTESGRQPLDYADRLTIVFNGAIYNFPELREELRAKGYAFQSSTDTEVILAAWLAWGPDCFVRFNGMWALAIIDHKEQQLILSRDRIGIKPLYIHQTQGLLAFASEPRTLRKTVVGGTALNLEVGRDFLVHGWQDHRPESIWAGISQFPAGHYAVCPLGAPDELTYTSYYHLPTAIRPGPIAALHEEFQALLTDAVRLRTRSDVGSGLTLSGGIDSSSIAAVMGPGHRSYSALFPGTPYDESPYVAAVIRDTGGTNHPLLPTWDDFLKSYEACALGQDQPLASAAVVIHYRLMQLVQATGEKVILNGQGADEIGAGYDKFYGPYLREMLHQGMLPGVKATWQVAKNYRMAPDKLSTRLQRRFGNLAPETFLAPAFAAKETFVRNQDKDVLSTSINLLTQVGLPVLLRHEDRSAMACGIESRPPFLDFRIVDFLLSAPTEFKLRNGVRKAGIRESLRALLPKEVYARKRKLGFATPQQRWLEEHSDFFLTEIKTYLSRPDALLKAETYQFAQRVLERKQTRHYPLVWRWWAWAVFCRK
ncbi:asparagine synthase (glutamine-hydrolyzing) [Neolewinella persica]|uniref:asparagine synthase (glutamine-hydrolyzing) n=1 Tax=Neolewinella persica TaxID=70998 RepID=UPI00036C0BE8|nr:asparagine synthase (glutamine-hydrolyzing) [Neolewinella persica]